MTGFQIQIRNDNGSDVAEFQKTEQKSGRARYSRPLRMVLAILTQKSNFRKALETLIASNIRTLLHTVFFHTT
jgi:hypothetical protein